MPKKGEIICLTTGEYSDYSIVGHFEVLKDFSLKEQRQAYADTKVANVPVMLYGYWTENKKYIRYEKPIPTGEFRKPYWSVDEWQAWLMREGFLKDLDVTEYNCDDYLREGE
jgi:hypothetical protein